MQRVTWISDAKSTKSVMRSEWNEWNGEDDKPQDQDSPEEIFHDPAEQSTLLVPSVDQDMNQSNIQDRGLRSLIDLSPIQPQREIPTLLPTLVGGVEGIKEVFRPDSRRPC